MTTLEEAAQKRLDARQKQADEAKRLETITAVSKSGSDMVAATSGLAKSKDIDSLLQEFKEIRLAQYMAEPAKPKDEKPTIILTDQTDLGDKLLSLGDRIATEVSKLDGSRLDADQLASLKELTKAIETAQKNAEGTAKTQHKELLSTLKSLKLSSVVNVPEPKVTVKETKVDFSPLQATMRELLTPKEIESAEKIDLECYHAQDIDNTNKDMQYIGFLNTEGNWYIIENDVKGNKLRYLFGQSGYQEAFAKAPMYDYLLLNEAVDAVSA